jgi:hypothetical protein
MDSVLVNELVIARSRKAVLACADGEFFVRNGETVFLSDDLDRFCKLLTTYWPLNESDSYRWMVNRLAGGNVVYSRDTDGQLAAVRGKPVNMFGVVQCCDYAPLDDFDNALDVISCIRQHYG